MKKRVHVTIKELIVFFLCLCVLSMVVNIYLKKTRPDAFAIDDGMVESNNEMVYISEDGRFNYTIINEDDIEIISYRKNKDIEIEIPSYVDGKKVVSLGECSFAYHNELKRILVPKTVDTLKLAVFGGSENLEYVFFSSDIKNFYNRVL